MNTIRQAGFWIIGARSAVSLYIMNCVLCRRLRGNPCGQKMADLPADRLEPAPPFSYSGVDYFGPFSVKEGRKELKRWGVMFTCFASRAVHIETSNSLDTDAFINAYRRFVCRRGPVRTLRCDRGTNFIGGRNELQSAWDEMDHAKISAELLKDSCDWVVIEPNQVANASHFGGVWERMILSARNTLSSILLQHFTQLDDEGLRTFLTEVEATINSRPLTFLDTKSPDELEPLCPSQLLTLKSKVLLPPPGVFVKQDIYCRKRWRRIQYLANQFWTRWRSEFLPTLQARSKWHKEQRNLQINDIVVLIDESLPRCSWPLARVTQVYPSDDGLVRKVQIFVGKTRTTLERPVTKLIMLVPQDEEEPRD